MITYRYTLRYIQTLFVVLAASVVGFAFLNITPPVDAASGDLRVNTASYVGSSSNDEVLASTIGRRYAFIAGKGYGGAGFISSLDTQSGKIIKTKNFDSIVNDIEYNTVSGHVALITQSGKAYTLDEGLNTKLTLQGASGNSSDARISTAKDGTIGTLISNNVRLYKANGSGMGSFGVRNSVKDLAVDSANKTVAIVGETQKNGAPCRQYRSGWMKGFSYNGQTKWKNYDWDRTEVKNDCADAAPKRIVVGPDGKLYMSADSAGGNSVFRWDGRKLGESTGPAGTIQVKKGRFTDSYNMSSQHITFVGRYNASNGNVEKGQFLLARTSKNRGNSMRTQDIAVDAKGNMYLAGMANANFPERGNFTVNGKKLGSYAGLDGYLIKITKDFQSRELSVGFQNNDAKSIMKTVSVSGDTVVTGGLVQKGSMITVNANQGSSRGGVEGYFAMWGSKLGSSTPIQELPQPPAQEPVVDEEPKDEVVEQPSEDQQSDEEQAPVETPVDNQPDQTPTPPTQEPVADQEPVEDTTDKNLEEQREMNEQLQEEIEKLREELNKLKDALRSLFSFLS